MSILIIRAMCCILPRVCPNFPWYSIYDLWRAFIVNISSAISSFSYVESVLKGISTFLNFQFGNHSFTSYMMWSVWSTLKPRGDWKTRIFNYLRTDLYRTFISKCSLKNIVSSGNAVSLLVVLRTFSVETAR